MTTRELDARRYSRRCRQRRRAQRARRLRMVTVFVLICMACALCYMGACGFESAEPEQMPDAVVVPPAAVTTGPSEPEQVPTQEATPEPVRYRDDIVSEGRLLSYELQEIMQDCCEEYEVPYALALAIAEVETHFDPDAVSSTGDYGLMQINKSNHEWLLEIGLDPMTHAGNIEAGVYIISQHLQAYGEPELALMAYNCGPTGARRLWDAGTYQTDYTRKVMTAFEYWTSVLEE